MSITFIEFLNQSGRCESPLPILVKATKKAEVEHIMNNTGWSKSIVMSLQKEFNAFKTVNLSESQIKDDVVLIPHYMATEYNAVAFHDDSVNVHIAIANPSLVSMKSLNKFLWQSNAPVLPFLTRIDDIQTIEKFYILTPALYLKFLMTNSLPLMKLMKLSINNFIN